MSGPALADLVAAARAGCVVAYGLTPPLAACVAARLAAADHEHPLFVVCRDEATVQTACEDIALFAPPRDPRDLGQPSAPPAALAIPAIDSSPYSDIRVDDAVLAARMAALYRLVRGGRLLPGIVVLPANALVRKVIAPATLASLASSLATGDEVDRDELVARLIGAGYARATVVEDVGTFAVRGGVLDVFSPLYRYPVRIELYGDTIDAMRQFDPDSQRTQRDIAAIELPAVREAVATRGARLRETILAAADVAHHPSTATRRLLEQIEAGEDFIGRDALAPAFHDRMVPLWTYASRGARWLVLDPDAVTGAARDELAGARVRYDERVADNRLALAPELHYVEDDELDSFLSNVEPRIEARTIELASADGGDRPGSPAGALRLAVDDNRVLRSELERARRQAADELLRPLVRALAAWRAGGWRIAIATGSAERMRQLAALLSDYDVAQTSLPGPDGRHGVHLEALDPGAPPCLLAGSLSAGFALPDEKIALLSADDIFGPRRKSSARQRAAARRARAALMGGTSDFSQLASGDHVVHELHGVGLYRGLVKLAVGRTGPAIDFLNIEYSGGRLYLPVYRLNEVARYVGAEGQTPRLDRLGGATWEKTRRKAAQAIKALAEELLQIYAQRAALPGHAFPPADAMFRELEATFPYDETPDQARAIDEVLADMESPRPMDRLVCGDVGYGKTEVALRAIFKAVSAGKQAVFLAPTTVLVEQHFRTMSERFAGWPVTIARLSRFQPAAEQVATVTRLAAGTVDAVVGTHRLLSNDVRFKDLGLIVIDEEQRFGVVHKEKLKRFRTQVDVLTLTATPIPRTLHLSMTGLKDLSIIATPPPDRRTVRTLVAQHDSAVLREGIRRELARAGQVFFVCPHISDSARPLTAREGRERAGKERAGKERAGKARGGRASDRALPPLPHHRSIYDWAEYLTELVPGIRVGVAHGQMRPAALEKAMLAFVAGETDVLVSTTVIENGLDIPRANTMFISSADHFGLAQLYQLRGRIGRSRERAFCYLLVPPLDSLLSDARRRLEVLQRYSELGAGFQIASHDLEIRGAGELFGARQSGAIAAVGFETYTAMLEEAVAELRGQDSPAIRRARDPELNIDFPGYLPDDYIPDPGQRLDFYKRLSDANSEDEVKEILAELADRYGSLPGEAIALADIMLLKVHARRLRARSLELDASRMILAFGDDTPLGPAAVAALVKKDRSYRLTPDMRLCRTFSVDEAREVVESARQSLLHLLACAT